MIKVTETWDAIHVRQRGSSATASSSRTPPRPAYTQRPSYMSCAISVSSASSDESSDDTHGPLRSMSQSSLESLSSSESFQATLPATKITMDPMTTSPLRVSRRKTATHGSSSQSSSLLTPPSKHASLRPLPRAPASPATPSSDQHDTQLRSRSPSIRRLPVPPLRSPGGDPGDAFGPIRKSVATSPSPSLRAPVWEEEDDSTIDWDLIGEVLCEEE